MKTCRFCMLKNIKHLFWDLYRSWFSYSVLQGGSSIEAVSLFPCSHHLVGTLILCNMRQTLPTQLRTRSNASHNSAVTCQCSNYSNNKLSRHLVGTLTSHCNVPPGKSITWGIKTRSVNKSLPSCKILDCNILLLSNVAPTICSWIMVQDHYA